MAKTDRQACEGIYHEGVGGDPEAFEQAWVRATFEVYSEAEEVAQLVLLPEEVRFSGPSIRRGMLERRIADGIAAFDGMRRPTYATRKSDGTQTSHYSVYGMRGFDITISAVAEEDAVPRFADFRQQRFAAVQSMLSFMPEQPVDETATLHMLFKHGKTREDSSIPQFAIFEVYDSDYVSIWRRDLFSTQAAFVESLLNEREQEVPDDAGIPTLRMRLRRDRFGVSEI